MPGFAHQPRWQAAHALQRLFSGRVQDEARRVDVVARLLASLPAAFPTWEALAQDQYLEARTLLSGYLLSSQGDRMLMAHSVEGRFPFLDVDVVELADSLPAAFKLHVLDEKHVLKMVAAGVVPTTWCGVPSSRTAPPTRPPSWGPARRSGSGRFFPNAASRRRERSSPVRERLWKKCRKPQWRSVLQRRQHGHRGRAFDRATSRKVDPEAPNRGARVEFKTMVDRMSTSREPRASRRCPASGA